MFSSFFSFALPFEVSDKPRFSNENVIFGKFLRAPLTDVAWTGMVVKYAR